MSRSILCILAGFAAMAALIMPATILSARLMLGARSREDMMTRPSSRPRNAASSARSRRIFST